MAFGNLTNSSKLTITLFILLTITSQITSASKPEEKWPKWDPKQQQLATVDAIVLTIQQVRGIKKLISKIPHLKGVRATYPSADPGLIRCTNDLTAKSTEIERTLLKLRHLKTPGLIKDMKCLKEVTSKALEFSVQCHAAFSEVDDVAASVITKDIENLGSMVDDVIIRIDNLENGKPSAANYSKAGIKN